MIKRNEGEALAKHLGLFAKDFATGDFRKDWNSFNLFQIKIY